MLKEQVKRETTLDKVPNRGRLKSTELAVRGSAKDSRDASQVPSPSASQRGRDEVNSRKACLTGKRFVPVIDNGGQPLMPTSPSRARRWVKSRKATYFWNRGVWCVRLNVEPSDRKLQSVVVGIDPGSKREGFTVQSAAHTYLNIQTSTVDWVKRNVETRKSLRKSRRRKSSPCKTNKANRRHSGNIPSTKSRWQWKLRIVRWLDKLFPINGYVAEEVSAKKIYGNGWWNTCFSPLEVGKKWFYSQLEKPLKLIQGYETAKMRKTLGLEKTKDKLEEKFSAHCVDSFTLAQSAFESAVLDNTSLLIIKPLQFKRRQLHVQNPAKGGYRRPDGSTRSMGFTRGSLVVNEKHGLCLLGGTRNNKISLHNLDGLRISRSANPSTITFLAYSKWIIRHAH